MAQSRHHLKNAYYDIYTTNDYFFENNNGQLIVPNKYKSIHNYCHYRNNPGKCNGYFELASSGVIQLLKTLKVKYNLEDDKLAEYAILFLSYKLNKKKKNGGINLNDFYTNYIETNNYYNNKINGNDSLTYMEIIDKKKDLMDININEISKSSGPFHILFYLNYVFHDEYLDCQHYLGLAKSFVNQFKVLNNDSKNIEDSPYSQILSTLSNDYKNLKKIYYDKNKSCNFPPLQELTPKKRSAENHVASPTASSVDKSVKDSLDNSVKDSLDNSVKDSLDNSVKSFAQSSGQTFGETPKVTSSSSSISTTLIPALSIFSIIPVFLGISYKTIFKKKIKKSKEEHET
ncbi:PIR protein CIR protein [Plasmodium vinckei]|uniref:PIR protein CIR protein n=1 Tax=Plasmodium vinckei TaxID=5860 RepID=A0A6V7T3D6_PLAVN|nr:PIR protein CIR protein [Plasmodium vinckei]